MVKLSVAVLDIHDLWWEQTGGPNGTALIKVFVVWGNAGKVLYLQHLDDKDKEYTVLLKVGCIKQLSIMIKDSL